MKDDFFIENEYGPKENKPSIFMIPVSSIWRWLKKKRKSKRRRTKNEKENDHVGNNNVRRKTVK